MANRQGLVPVKRTVVRGGKSYITTVYVRPGDQKKVQDKHVQIPDWSFKNVSDFESEVARINKIKDPSEKKVLKDHLIEHLKKNGIQYKEDNGVKADAINWMRALMAAKKHLKEGNQIESSSSTPEPQQNNNKVSDKIVLGTGKPMSKEEAKKAVSELRAKIGTQAVMDLAEKNGIQWAKNPNHLANSYMQCAMKLSKHLQAGGVLTEDGNAQSNQASNEEKEQPKSEQPKSKLKEDNDEKAPKDPNTIEYDWYHAPKKYKMIGMITGILPVDEDTHNYLENLIKSGKFDLNEDDVADTGIKIAKIFKEEIKRLVDYRNSKGFSPLNAVNPDSRYHDQGAMFKGTEYEKAFEDYRKAFYNFATKYGREVLGYGVNGIDSQLKAVELLDEIANGKDLSELDQYSAVRRIQSYFDQLSQDPKKAEEAWDRLNMDDLLNFSWFDSTNPVLTVIRLASTVLSSYFHFGRYLDKSIEDHTTFRSRQQLAQAVNSGSLSKQKAFLIMKDAVQRYLAARTEHISGKESMLYQLNNAYSVPLGAELLDRYLKTEKGGKPENFKNKDFIKYAKKALIDSAPLYTKDADYIKTNLYLLESIRARSTKSSSLPKNWEPIDRDLWDASRSKRKLLEQHIWYLKKSESARKKWKETEKKNLLEQQRLDDIDYLKEFNKGTNPETLEFPDYKNIRNKIKASLEKVIGQEKENIINQIKKTHDKANHHFETVVHGIYRIKNLPIEKAFQKIDKERNNTGFYYHGTGYGAAQKIIGKSGQFVVTRTNINTGRMLGDGVYLASESSKSVQYASNNYGRGAGRGVLYVCQASLGKVATSVVRDEKYNRRLLNRSDVDTVYMGRPKVLNPEWAVKEEKAVIPRFWIDVERVR